MFKYLIFCAAVGLTLAAPQHRPQPFSGDEAHAEVKFLHSDVRADGFNYGLETSNGIHAESSGDAVGNVHGDFEWVSPEGEHIKVTYVADENGYQPQSNVLPTPPPIPDAILRSLEYIRTHPPKDDRAYNNQPSAVNYHSSSFQRKQDRLNAVRCFYEQFNYAPFLIYAGSQPYLLISDPNNMEFILSSTTLTYKYDLYNFLYPWLGNGLLTSNGQHWLKHRKMITPSFHFTILQDFLHIINETTDRFMVLLDGFAKTQEIFDFQEIVARCTVDVICESAMGTRVNAIAGPTSPIVAALNDICFVIQERIFSVFKRFQPIYVFSKEYRTQERALRVLRKELSQIIEKRQDLLKSMDKTKKYADDDMKRPKMAFLDNLLTAEIDGRSLTFQEIFEEVSTFMFEGHDTTSTAISFITFCLSRHPEAQAKAFDEQLRMFGPDLTRTPTYQEVQDMKYLEMVIKESLRLFPSVPFIGRTLKERTVIAGYTVPEGTTLLLNIFGVGTNAANYPEPFKFQPERFEADSREKAHPFGFVPFSAGPRNCIGQKFAMMELKVTVSKMLRHFQILPAVDGLSAGIPDKAGPNVKPNNPYDPQLGVLITLKSVNGIKIRLQKRIY